ncbi:Y-family DNA polymerase [Steroidobacter flavus]|uniref:Y-family DNA polymerase n=1 Tax=Steroidobacter flavus TaxID=1842136 RepID=A0ABV8SZ27_9GAMM
MSAALQLTLFDPPAHAVASVRAPIEVAQAPTPTPARSPKRSQAWLALHFADLARAAAYQAAVPERRALLDASAWAVIDTDRLKHVVACNERAWRHGVRPGHRMNAAIALCASLELVSREVASETHLLERIATTCLEFTSAVSVQPPNEVLLEVRGSFRLFGGAQALIARLEAALANLDAGLQVALAPTARAAQWLARASNAPRVCLPRELPGILSAVPIASLHWPLAIELQLMRFGVGTVADLMRLSRKDLARRIGAGPVHELAQALGRTPWLQRGWSTPPGYHDRVLLEFEIETTTLLEKMLERPLARLQRTLIGAARAIDELTLTLKHREGATALHLRLQQASSDTAHVASLLHEHLDRLTLRAPVREVAIEAPRLLLAQPHHQVLALDPDTRAELPELAERKARLLERLQSRFGVPAVRALISRAHHVPECAQANAAPCATTPAVAPPAHLPRRPLWLFREPTPATREYREGAFRIVSSPETIEAEPWDGPSVRRAYYRAHASCGLECWIYRDLDLRDEWFVHGLFG